MINATHTDNINLNNALIHSTRIGPRRRRIMLHDNGQNHFMTTPQNCEGSFERIELKFYLTRRICRTWLLPDDNYSE
ncbi:hypothetical protein NPIL_58471 [Nephila pilipes]|uniref:Uncharacterized protein n=1 Tax=Nephila pilipes TaxID=299642 RepID=A0A8X6PK75_NEPPI|nr:hypothetical protein NPIL_58471 [Nephila pilipes]